MRFSKIITGILFTSFLFAQADKGKEQSRPIPKKFNDGHALELIKNQMQFNSDEEIKIPGYGDRFNNSGINHGVEDDIIIEQGISIPARRHNSNRELADTLGYYPPGGWGGQFIMYPGDAMWTVFQMPTDGILKGINVPVYEWGMGDQELTVSLHKMSYPYTSEGTMYSSSAVDGAGWIGGYDMDSTTGWMSIEGTTYTPGGTQGVCDSTDIVVTGAQDPLGLVSATSGPPQTPLMGLLWPDGSTAAIMTPSTHPDFEVGGNDANWIDLADYGSEVNLLQGEWVGILVASTGTGGGDDDATGFFYNSGWGFVDPWVSGKFYGECTGTSGNGGWHIRNWIFNFQLAVELTGDRAPVFESYDYLVTTLSTEDRTVTAHITDDNPSGGDAGVASAQIIYQLDSLTAQINIVNMTLISGDIEDGIWEGGIPGQDPCTPIYYQYRAVDVNGNVAETVQLLYFIFCPIEGRDLIFNNQDKLFGNLSYSSYLYFYWGGKGFDIWDASYGGLTDELLQYYDVLIELSGNGGPIFNNDEEIANWWDGDKTYIVCGDEWLGYRSGWVNGPAEDGSVTKSILGIDYEYNDINYGASGDQNSISRLIPDSAGFASILYEFLSDSLLLNYDPQRVTGNNNWLDGIDPVEGYTVDMTAYSGVLDSADQVDPPAGSEIYNVMIHGQAGNGGKSAFLAFDALALNTVPSYYWVGASDYWYEEGGAFPDDASPLIQAYEGLATIVSVNDDDVRPNQFSLKGNYPNPFNPVTNIQYELHKNTHVKITIYDVLGREVKKLVSSELVSGYHKVIWDATNDQGKPVAAGIYLYQIRAGNFVQTRKMVLLK